MVPRGTCDGDDLQARICSLEAQLEHMHRLAALGTVAAMIAHEFNNLLTPIMSYASLALADPGNPALARKALERAAEGSHRAAEISQAILEFVRLEESAESPGIQVNQTGYVADPLEALEGVRRCLARDHIKDGIRLSIGVRCDSGVAIKPVCLQQVILNLLLNARRAVGAKGGSIEFSVTDCSSGAIQPSGSTCLVGVDEQTGRTSRYVLIRVSDDGCGMTADQIDGLKRSFGVCQYSERPRLPADRSQGNGLGLAICKQIIARAGGGMWVQSTVGKGTTFTIVLPAAAPISQRAPAPGEPAAPGKAKAA